MDEPTTLDKYLAMRLDELKALWDDGNYPGPIEDYNAIRGAVKVKMGLRRSTPYACSRCSYVACVCGKSTLQIVISILGERRR